ncbi:Hypothetical predicted protein [Podarcis lilfordi]|uniref:Uncharacterized protein n=1 Tax=Podarcis lilfordi TaxID=74358 RepID=A0AA35LH04_9SAUR|nr:Hypothetical predicted protein [Podarcis lilfordi]
MRLFQARGTQPSVFESLHLGEQVRPHHLLSFCKQAPKLHTLMASESSVVIQ